eukprot:2416851-Rhodomonas_salina.1
MSFGWRRAEVVGAFANGCFLLAVCFTISLEAIEKLAGIGRDNQVPAPKHSLRLPRCELSRRPRLPGLCLFAVSLRVGEGACGTGCATPTRQPSASPAQEEREGERVWGGWQADLEANAVTV